MRRKKRKKGWLALVSYAASPQGRRRLRQLQRRLDTPANRRRAVEMKAAVAERVLASRRPKR